jgi:hypothetical protein
MGNQFKEYQDFSLGLLDIEDEQVKAVKLLEDGR